MKHNLLTLSILFLFIIGCTTSRNAGTVRLVPKSANFTTTTAEVLSELRKNKVDVEWLSAKLDLSIDSDQQSVKASGNLRLHRDSLIWINIRKLGIEVARMEITPDSVYLINYLDKSYLIKDLKYLERQFGVPADFSQLQQLILGNPVFFGTDDSLRLKVDSTQYHLSGNNNRQSAEYRIDAGSFLLKKMFFKERWAGRELSITQDRYQSLPQVPNFSYLRIFNVTSPETGIMNAEVEWSNLEVNVPKNIRFEIPDHYDRQH